ncbi:BspA family leucine-rich repeat surface protein [Flavobacteriales bacterium]|nr:BspA family leucine-rich repeat surface protein [Flavobacteriales bacterium]
MKKLLYILLFVPFIYEISANEVCNDPNAANTFQYADPTHPNYVGESQLQAWGIIVNNDVCQYPGCTDPEADNYDLSATHNDGSCIYPVGGCTDPLACNYNIEANIQSIDCVYKVSIECDECSGQQDGTGTLIQLDIDGDGICDEDEIVGCTDMSACDFVPLATDDSICEYPENFYNCDGCINDNDGDGICDELEVIGCTDTNACNLDSLATENDGSCTYSEEGYDCDGNFAPEIGDIVEGGIVFYIDESGERGLVADLEDLGIGFWRSQYLEMADTSTSQGYDDWFLPSVDVLKLMYNTIGNGGPEGNIGGFTNTTYYASNYTESSCLHFITFGINPLLPYSGFSNGAQISSCGGGYSGSPARAIRSFGYTRGCMNSDACNFNINANANLIPDYDDNINFNPNYSEYDSCEFPDLGYNCDGNDLEIHIGQFAFGGIVFYVDETGERGLVAAMEDLSAPINDPWGNYGYEWGCHEENVDGSDGTLIGTGYQNTMDIVNQGCTTEYGGITAAQAALNAEINGYNDWFLPSKDALFEISMTIGSFSPWGNIGNFLEDSPRYWSSTEVPLWIDDWMTNNRRAYSGWYASIVPSIARTSEAFKHIPASVRVVRAFGYTLGCMDEASINYNSVANMSDGSCIPIIEGCMDEIAFNYNVEANTDDGSCIPIIEGCIDSLYAEYDSTVNTDDGTCITLIIEGCMDETAFNYNVEANTDDGSCIPIIEGCIDSLYTEYDSNVNTDDGTCQFLSITQENIYEAVDLYMNDLISGMQLFGSISEWDVSSVTDMAGLFAAYNITCDLSSWDVSNVTDMSEMFLLSWGLEDMLDLSSWDVSNVINMNSMFTLSDFNGDLSNWDVSNVVDMNSMFNYASSFNGDISNWDVSNVVDMTGMFAFAHDFNGNISNWDLSNVTNMDDMLFGVNLPIENECAIQESFSTNEYWPHDWCISDCTYEWADNYHPDAVIDDSSCYRLGCMSDWADNYDFFATIDDTSCYREGCTYSFMFNYDALATIADTSCIPFIYGCTDAEAFNFDEYANANVDDGSCIDVFVGCTFDWADNYNPDANTNDGSCDRLGCIVIYMDNYDNLATTDDGSCYREGCMSEWADNFDDGATIDDGSCVLTACSDPYFLEYNPNYTIADTLMCITNIIEGCTNSSAENYNPEANLEDGTCVIIGCTSLWADNYDPQATTDDGSCYLYGCNIPSADNYDEVVTHYDASCIWYGCTDLLALNYYPVANYNDESCYYVNGCMVDTMFNYNPIADNDDGSCIPVVHGCMDISAFNYNYEANTDDGSCIPFIYGCIDTTSYNYDDLANTNDDSCTPFIYGCTDSEFYNYNVLANTNDGSCIPFIYGCTNPLSFNHDSDANTDDGSCIPMVQGCMDATAFNYNSDANTDDGLCEYGGCTDSEASNYDFSADIEDGTCEYDLITLLNQSFDAWNVSIDLSTGWNMFGYGCPSPIDVADGLFNHTESTIITKDNAGNVYMPEFSFNGIGDFTPGFGYQIKVTEAIDDFSLCDWYVNDIPEDNIIYLQEENAVLTEEVDSLQEEVDFMSPYFGCVDTIACNYDSLVLVDDESCTYPETGYNCDGFILITQENIYQAVDSWLEDSVSTETIYGHISDWDVSSVTDMGLMFQGAESFNGDISSWDVSSVTNMGSMFYDATSFSSDLSSWDVSNVEHMTDIFHNSGMTPEDQCSTHETLSLNPNWPYEWECPSFQVGEFAEGGVVFYIDETGQHGLVAAMEDLPGTYDWGCSGSEFEGADGILIGTGYQNTIDIAVGCPETTNAASMALAYEIQSYSDWYLPSKDELLEMYNTIGNGSTYGNIGGFEIQFYWSSTQFDNVTAWYIHFNEAYEANTNKISMALVRPIRSF